MKTPPLRPEQRADTLLINPSFAPTDATGTTPQALYDSLRGGDHEALTRAWRRRNRKHALEVK